jgi:Putative peptidoglycan binding domain/Transglycosylase SLT domain
MPDFTRNISFQSPLMRGPDVLAAQRALRSLGSSDVLPDGLYGSQTAAGVSAFQRQNAINPTGVVDRETWDKLFTASPGAPLDRDFGNIMARLKQPQQFRDSVTWRLGEAGIEIAGAPAVGSPGQPVTVIRILNDFKAQIANTCVQRNVPVELIVASIAVESTGNRSARRNEPGWTSDSATPDKVSIGLMQTLISTARDALNDPTIDAARLEDPATSIEAGAAYIDSQFALTGFDPAKVGCVYNAGGLYYNSSPTNRWRMRQYPIGTSDYLDKLIPFFNDCFSLLRANGGLIDGPTFAAHW